MNRSGALFAVAAAVAAGLLVAGLVGANPLAPELSGAPAMVSYQGQVTVGGAPYHGDGTFKFAVVNTAGNATFWSNDGTSTGGAEPTGDGVPLAVTGGWFQVLLGDTSLEGMTRTLGAGEFSGPDRNLRVWFSPTGGAGTFTQISPEQRFPSVPYALQAEKAVDADTVDGMDAGDLPMPSGAMVLGLPADSRLTDAGYVEPGMGISFDDQWQSTATTDAPSQRERHTAVWTGSQMIVWGGRDGSYRLDSGGRYDPAADTWAPTITSGAPDGRAYHSAVWTGSEMIIWGGWDVSVLDGGKRYDPLADTWSPMAAAPEGRMDHTTVWTGSEMIVWGGYDFEGNVMRSGRRYDPAANTWAAMSTSSAPEIRAGHTAVWTGSEMIVWGGRNGPTYLNSGARYDPATDTWAPMTTDGAPVARYRHSAVWTGSEMVIWGGSGSGSGVFNSGGRYDPATDSWTAVSTTGSPVGRIFHTAVWTGGEVIFWGGEDSSATDLQSGGRYDPAADTWAATTTTGAPTPRYLHSALWTGSKMVVWGGVGGGYLNSGGQYLPPLHLYQKP